MSTLVSRDIINADSLVGLLNLTIGANSRKRHLLRQTLNHGWYIFTPPYLDHFTAAADSVVELLVEPLVKPFSSLPSAMDPESDECVLLPVLWVCALSVSNRVILLGSKDIDFNKPICYTLLNHQVRLP